MNIAVTAASGQLGAAIVEALKGEIGADSVVALARTPKKAEGLGVEVRPGDYTKPDELKASLAGVDKLLLVSGMDAPEKRIPQHRNVIEAARANGVKKIVYTSIQGAEAGTAFSPVVDSNRQTEADVKASGLDWAIGRNGIYIEPDIEYIEQYKALGEVANCAGEGKCAYTTRSELAYAYAQLLLNDDRNGRTYRLHGDRLTQQQLTDYLNQAFGTQLVYHAVSFEAFKERSIRELGAHIGVIVAGIYQGIAEGVLDVDSDFEAAAGRPHESWDDFFASIKA